MEKSIGLTSAKEIDSKDYSVNYEKVEDTPFTIAIVNEEKYFGVIGEFRVTEEHDSKEECIEDCKRITWNRIITIVSIIIDKKEEVRKINEKLK